MSSITSGTITPNEYAARRERARTATREADLDALLICSRGGGALDRYGDVMYLSGFYTSFPYIPDHAPDWSARAHAFMVVPADGEATLVADIPFLDDLGIPREQVVLADQVLESVLEVLTRAGLGNGRVGLVGGDTLPTSHYLQLTGALPDMTLVPSDPLLSNLRAVKSPAEIELLRRSARLGSRTIEAMLDAARPGATHGDVVAAGMQVLVPAGGVLYNSFMASGTGGESPTVTRSRFPTWASPAPLAEGEWLRLGISGVVEGYVFDVSRSKAIGRATNRQIDAFEAAISVIESGVAVTRRGSTAADVARAGLETQRRLGYPVDGVFSGLGHGIGLGWDAPWLTLDDHTPLVENMVINIEKTLSSDGYLGDFEETVLITASGPELLTDARKRSW